MTDIMDFKHVPQEIFEAAEAVTRFFRKRNVLSWKVSGCASREWLEELAAPAAEKDARIVELAKLIHYPDCWDTACYPTLESALQEIGCGEHRKPCAACSGTGKVLDGETCKFCEDTISHRRIAEAHSLQDYEDLASMAKELLNANQKLEHDLANERAANGLLKEAVDALQNKLDHV